MRDFDGADIADEDVRAVLEQALLAPSSGNLQPYQLHWLRNSRKKRHVAAACDPSARIEPRWRRAFADAVVDHA